MGNMLRIIDLLERGVQGGLLFRFFLTFIPYLLTFSIPMSILTASLLVFGRMSAENEITAMRACGIGFYVIFRSGFLIALGLVAICLYINMSVAPRAHYAMRRFRDQIGKKSPAAVLEPGIFIDYFRPYQVYVEQKRGNTFEGVIIYEAIGDNRTRFYRGSHGEVTTDEDGKIVFKIYDVIMEEPAKNGEGTSITGSSPTYIVRMGTGDEEDFVPKKMSDHTFSELLEKIERFRAMKRTAGPAMRKDLGRRVSIVRMEISERFVYTFCVLAFVLIGMPLGVTAHRGETTIGAAISLTLVGLNYAFIICMEALNTRPELYPYLLVWIPNVVFAVLGPFLTYRLARR
jgi:lipopolysaccharide export system permease protein